ncbi:MAG: GIY-YIG nuclease family protein [Selenomonadaceae bacterium]|nr:GIY-YIG nuclease family protein [Selenomonadaceae bacterium]
MINGVIYFLLNTISGKIYVGQTTNLRSRITAHKCGDQYVDRAIKKYGWENFRCYVIKNCASKAAMDTWEKFFIILLNTKRPNGYNLTDGGEGIVGLKRTPEHTAKISAALTGKPLSPEHCASISAGRKGISLSPEHCAKIGETLRGVPKTPEHCAHISAGQRYDSPYKNLIAEMDKRQLTYAALATIVGLPRQSFSEKMRGNQNFTMRQIDKFVKFFGLPAEYLLARDDGLPTTISKLHKTPYKNLLIEMEKHNLNYKALAKMLGFSKQVFSSKMRGELNFTAKDKVKLIEIFNKPIEYLLFKEEFL